MSDKASKPNLFSNKSLKDSLEALNVALGQPESYPSDKVNLVVKRYEEAIIFLYTKMGYKKPKLARFHPKFWMLLMKHPTYQNFLKYDDKSVPPQTPGNMSKATLAGLPVEVDPLVEGIEFIL